MRIGGTDRVAEKNKTKERRGEREDAGIWGAQKLELAKNR